MIKMNLYEMYNHVDRRFPFYVRRKTWGNTVAKVTGIETVSPGHRIPGRSPYYKGQPVEADFIRIDNGDVVEEHSTISCPGTYSYFLCNEKGDIL